MLPRVLTAFSPDIFSPSSLNDLSVSWLLAGRCLYTHQRVFGIPFLPALVNNHSQAWQILLVSPLLLYCWFTCFIIAVPISVSGTCCIFLVLFSTAQESSLLMSFPANVTPLLLWSNELFSFLMCCDCHYQCFQCLPVYWFLETHMITRTPF